MVNKIIKAVAIIITISTIVFFNLTIYSLEKELLKESAIWLFITAVALGNAIYDWYLVDSDEDE